MAADAGQVKGSEAWDADDWWLCVRWLSTFKTGFEDLNRVQTVRDPVDCVGGMDMDRVEGGECTWARRDSERCGALFMAADLETLLAIADDLPFIDHSIQG